MEFENKTEKRIKVQKENSEKMRAFTTLYPGDRISTNNKVFANSYKSDGLTEVEPKTEPVVKAKITENKEVETKQFDSKKKKEKKESDE